MRPSLLARAALALAAALALGVPESSHAGRPRPPSTHESVGFQNFLSPQANPIALSPNGGTLYVANTTSGTLSVISTSTSSVIQTVTVAFASNGKAYVALPSRNDVAVVDAVNYEVIPVCVRNSTSNANTTICR